VTARPDDALSAALGEVAVVLVTPRDATNVGAVVRAMGNFGLRHLRLVEPAAFDEGRVLAVAHRGGAVAGAITRHASLEEAVADCVLVVGTTARRRAVHHEVLRPWQAAAALLAAGADGAQGARVALVFGPEDTGLTNDHLGCCHAVSTIPTAPGDPSLNLGQAALLHAYELWLAAHPRYQEGRGGRETGLQRALAEAGAEPLARGGQREEMLRALADVVWAMHPNNDVGRVGSIVARLRAMLLRAVPRADETRLLTTILTHIAHALRRLPHAGPPPPTERRDEG
jgi:TrmH family RNA methyltransferase